MAERTIEIGGPIPLHRWSLVDIPGDVASFHAALLKRVANPGAWRHVVAYEKDTLLLDLDRDGGVLGMTAGQHAAKFLQTLSLLDERTTDPVEAAVLEVAGVHRFAIWLFDADRNKSRFVPWTGKPGTALPETEDMAFLQDVLDLNSARREIDARDR